MKTKGTDIGDFYFTITEKGNLLGEFTNKGMNGRWNIESANYFEGHNGNFACTYITTWLEDEKSFKAILKIMTTDEISYKLYWKHFNGETIFFGDAKRESGILKGHYYIRTTSHNTR